MSFEKNSENKQALYVGALIFSLIGGVLLLIDDFAYWEWFVWGQGSGAGWIGFPSAIENFPDSILILPLFPIFAGCLFYSSAISLWALINQDNPPQKQLFLLGIILALATVGVCLVGGLITFIEMLAEDLDWDFGGAFYGGVIGGAVTALFMYLLWRD